MIDNSNNEIRGGGVKRGAGGDEKQLIKFAWPYVHVLHFIHPNNVSLLVFARKRAAPDHAGPNSGNSGGRCETARNHLPVHACTLRSRYYSLGI